MASTPSGGTARLGLACALAHLRARVLDLPPRERAATVKGAAPRELDRGRGGDRGDWRAEQRRRTEAGEHWWRCIAQHNARLRARRHGRARTQPEAYRAVRIESNRRDSAACRVGDEHTPVIGAVARQLEVPCGARLGRARTEHGQLQPERRTSLRLHGRRRRQGHRKVSRSHRACEQQLRDWARSFGRARAHADRVVGARVQADELHAVGERAGVASASTIAAAASTRSVAAAIAAAVAAAAAFAFGRIHAHGGSRAAPLLRGAVRDDVLEHARGQRRLRPLHGE